MFVDVGVIDGVDVTDGVTDGVIDGVTVGVGDGHVGQPEYEHVLMSGP